MFVCICRGISEAVVQRVGREGVVEPDALVARFGLDDHDICCGRCQEDIDEFVVLARTGIAQARELLPLVGAH